MLELQHKKLLTYGLLLLSALWFSWEVVQGNWFLPLTALVFLLLLIIQKAERVSPEGVLLSVMVFGYIVGNRGFAQSNLMGVFIGELSIIALLGFGIIQISYRKELPYKLDPLGLAILAFMIIGGVRLFIDFPRHGFLALRDSAICYYGIFYFLAQPVAEHANSQKFFQRITGISLLALMPCYLLFIRFPQYFLNNFQVNGVPLIYYKFDLVGSYLGAAFLFFYFHFRQSPRLHYMIAAASGLLLMFHTTSRAALPGFLIGTTMYYLSNAGNAFRFILFSLLVTGVPIGYFYFATEQDLTNTRVYAVAEHVVSLVDFQGQFHYSNPEARNTGANNRYRIEWWQNVTRETLQHNPWIGLGFGYDLAARFVQDYYQGKPRDFSVRSPHSIIMTTFGRLGFIGLASFLAIIALMTRESWRCVLYSRLSGKPHPALPWWGMAWMLLGSATFGVVLEGPMGAIPFWAFLGIAQSLNPYRSEDEFLNNSNSHT